MNPLVTISIPIYRCEDRLAACLESVLKQTYQNIEVSLINDQTPDKSVEIAENFIKKNNLQHSWEIFSLPKNGGLSVVRNKGIELAKGKYIFFLDSDDELFLNAIEKLVDLAERTDSEMTMGEVEGVKLPENTIVDVFPITVASEILSNNDDILSDFVEGKFAVSSWNKLLKIEFLRTQQLYFTEGLFAQDSLHTFEMCLHINKVAFLREKTYRYFLHENSVIHNRKEIHFNNWITIANKLDFYYKKELNASKKVKILKYLVDFKSLTLLMNWKAQKNEILWKKSYKSYSKLAGLRISDYFSSQFSTELKKKNFFISLPLHFGFKFFKWRYER